MFIRTKKIKKKAGIFEYAYIVENRRVWKTKIKQKSKKYLGRVYRPERKNIMDFYEFHSISDVEKYVNTHSREEILNDLLKLELFNYGFKANGLVWEKDGCFVDLPAKRAYNAKGKDIALALNEGFLTGYAIKKLLEFRAEGEEDGYVFAKMFIEAGIAVPKDVFVGIFRKAMRQ